MGDEFRPQWTDAETGTVGELENLPPQSVEQETAFSSAKDGGELEARMKSSRVAPRYWREPKLTETF